MSLFDLPREIRDEIYSHIFDFPKYTMPFRSWHRPADFNILQASKQASNEALRVLYATSSFQIYLDPKSHHLPDGLFSPKTTHLIQEITIDIPMDEYSDRSDRKDRLVMEQKFEKVITRLLELSHPRKTCRVFLRRHLDAGFQIQDTNFIEALRKLVGYEAVVVQYGFSMKRLRVPRNINLTHFVHPREERVMQTKAALEPFLGPAVAYAEPEPVSSASTLRFEPRRNLAEVAGEEERDLLG